MANALAEFIRREDLERFHFGTLRNDPALRLTAEQLVDKDEVVSLFREAANKLIKDGVLLMTDMPDVFEVVRTTAKSNLAREVLRHVASHRAGKHLSVAPRSRHLLMSPVIRNLEK